MGYNHPIASRKRGGGGGGLCHLQRVPAVGREEKKKKRTTEQCFHPLKCNAAAGCKGPVKIELLKNVGLPGWGAIHIIRTPHFSKNDFEGPKRSIDSYCADFNSFPSPREAKEIEDIRLHVDPSAHVH